MTVNRGPATGALSKNPLEKVARAANAVDLIHDIIADPEYLEHYFGPSGAEFLKDGGFHTLISLIHLEKGQMMDEDEKSDMQSAIDTLSDALHDKTTEFDATKEELDQMESARDEKEKDRQILENCLSEISTLIGKVI